MKIPGGMESAARLLVSTLGIFPKSSGVTSSCVFQTRRLNDKNSKTPSFDIDHGHLAHGEEGAMARPSRYIRHAPVPSDVAPLFPLSHFLALPVLARETCLPLLTMSPTTFSTM